MKIELFKLESSDRKRLCSHNGSDSLQLSGNSYLRNPRQKRFLRNELQPVRKSHPQSGGLEQIGTTLPGGQRAFGTLHVNSSLNLTAKVSKTLYALCFKNIKCKERQRPTGCTLACLLQ